jgi:hypothetical protein
LLAIRYFAIFLIVQKMPQEIPIWKNVYANKLNITTPSFISDISGSPPEVQVAIWNALDYFIPISKLNGANQKFVVKLDSCSFLRLEPELSKIRLTLIMTSQNEKLSTKFWVESFKEFFKLLKEQILPSSLGASGIFFLRVLLCLLKIYVWYTTGI